MGSALAVALVKYGLLALLWLFVIAAVRTIRSDLWGSARAGARPAAAAPARTGGKPAKRKVSVIDEAPEPSCRCGWADRAERASGG